MLEALHPGRIDLGIGRAPGTDQLTARALRRSPGALAVDDFPEQLVELIGYFSGEFPEGHPYARITAVPGLGHRPALWLLGSSDYSAQAAGMLGLPFSFAHHFAAANTEPAVRGLPGDVPPVGRPRRARTSCSASRSCAPRPTTRPGGWPGSGALGLPAAAHRAARPLPDARGGGRVQLHAARARGDQGVDRLARRRRPGHGAAALAELAERTGADELMITTLTHSPDARLASYRLVAEAAGLDARTSPAGVTRESPVCAPGDPG